MIGQKGSLLDKIKAFFIRRRNNKIKKKEQQRKELEEILKNISEKVEPIGTVVNVGVAVDKIDLKRVSLSTNKHEVHVVKRRNSNNDDKVQNDILDKNKLENQLSNMSYDELKELRKNLLNKDKVANNIVIGAVPFDETIKHENINVDDKNNVKEDSLQDIVDIKKDDIYISNEVVIDSKDINKNQEEIELKKNIDEIKESKENKDNLVDNVITVKNQDVFHNDLENKEQLKEEKDIVDKQENSKRFVLPYKDKNVFKKEIKSTKIKKKNVNIFNFKTQKKKETSNFGKEEELADVLLRMINRNLSELSYFKEELEYLNDKNKKAITEEEIFEVEQRFLILKENIERAYRDFLTFKHNNIMENISELNYNEELVELVSSYKLEIIDGENIEQIMKNIESEFKSNLNIIEEIVCLEKSKEILEDDIYSNKEDIRIRDENIELTRENVDKINYMKEKLDSDIKNNNEIIQNMIQKISTIHPEERVSYHYNVVSNLVHSALNFTFGITMMNRNNGILANTLGAVSVLNSVRTLRRAFTPQQEVYYVASNDFENEIVSHLNDFSYINKNIDMSIEELDKIKNEFNDKFLQYIDDIPDIRETYNSINNLQEQLKDIKIDMKNQESRLIHSREVNNELVKRIND